MATITHGHTDPVQSTDEPIVTVAKVEQFLENTPKLPASTALTQVKAFSSESNDGAISLPLDHHNMASLREGHHAGASTSEDHHYVASTSLGHLDEASTAWVTMTCPAPA